MRGVGGGEGTRESLRFTKGRRRTKSRDPVDAETLFPEVLQANVHYSGRVQGVGFRAQVLEVARGHEVSGYVRNLPDGRVELAVEGEAAEVEVFLAAVANRMAGFIRSVERRDQKVVPTMRGFMIQ